MPRQKTKVIKDLKPLLVSIADLKPDPDNARKHSAKNIDAIAFSLDAHGQRKPLVVQMPSGTVRAGNGTLLAANQLGWTHIAVVRIKESNRSAMAYAIRDNRTAELASWDDDVLSASLDELQEHGFDLNEFGFGDEDESNDSGGMDSEDGGVDDVDTSFDVLITCESEEQQAEVLELCSKKDWSCRALM